MWPFNSILLKTWLLRNLSHGLILVFIWWQSFKSIQLTFGGGWFLGDCFMHDCFDIRYSLTDLAQCLLCAEVYWSRGTPTWLYLILDSGQLLMATRMVPPLGSTFPALSGLLIYAFQSMILFVLTDSYLVYPGIRGWSGADRRTRSSIALNLSKGILVWFLKRMGRLLNSWGPLIPNEGHRILWTRGGADGRIFGTWHILPRRGCYFEAILVAPSEILGAPPSKMCHVYSMIYISHLLSREYRLRDSSYSESAWCCMPLIFPKDHYNNSSDCMSLTRSGIDSCEW